MNICVIPCFQRPEYLSICLEHIQNADKSENMAYIFAVDVGASKDNDKVIKNFPYKKYVVTPKDYHFKLAKQSYNVLNGLLAAASMSDDLVHYVEDDVFVGKDYFTFHESIHKKEKNIFCSILSRNVNGNDAVENNLNAYYVKQTNQYCGIGSCYKAQFLTRYITPDFNMDYFRQPLTYVKIHYPDSPLNNSYCEQDGLIRRIIEKNELQVAYSHVARCFHAGFYGYHRAPKVSVNKLTMANKIELIKSVVYDVDKLRQVSENEWYVTDSIPVPLDTEHKRCIRVDL